MGRVLFPLGALVGVALAAVAFASIAQPPDTLVLPLGLPDLPFHVRRDALGERVPVPARRGVGRHLGVRRRLLPQRRGHALRALLCLQYHVFLASMGFVLLADDAYAFMVAWETMALSSYFLVTTQHRIARDPARRASCIC